MALPINLPLQQATIAAGASLSGLVSLGAFTLVGIFLPAAWTTAALTFQASPDGGVTFYEVNDAAANFVIASAAAGTFIGIDPSIWRGVNCLVVRSGSAASPIVQAQTVTLLLAGRLTL
jgi:hypothetical protein